MPLKSIAQWHYFEEHKPELEREGVDVDEWEHATDFSHLPEKKSMQKKVDIGEKSFKVKEGSLHDMLGIPRDEKIGQQRLEKAEHSRNPTIRKKAISGMGLSHMHKG